MCLNTEQLSPLEVRCSLPRCLCAASDICYVTVSNAEEQNDLLHLFLSMKMAVAKQWDSLVIYTNDNY